MTDFEKYRYDFGARFKELVFRYARTAAEFGENIGAIDSSGLGKVFRGDRLPSVEILIRIKEAYPNFDIDYLLFGNKKKYSSVAEAFLKEIITPTTKQAGTLAEPATDYNNYIVLYKHSQETVAALQQALQAKEDLINELRNKINTFK